MKFWKETLLTTIVFLSIITSVLYTACTQDPCSGLTCVNGGTCLNGLCKCPTGYEGSTCQINAADKFLGRYIGATTCNQGNSVVDTVDITLVSKPNQVNIVQHSSGYSFTGIASGTSIQATGVPDFNISLSLNNNFLTLFVSQQNGSTTSNCSFVGSPR